METCAITAEKAVELGLCPALPCPGDANPDTLTGSEDTVSIPEPGEEARRAHREFLDLQRKAPRSLETAEARMDWRQIEASEAYDFLSQFKRDLHPYWDAISELAGVMLAAGVAEGLFEAAVRTHEIEELRELPYPEYLKSDHWQEMRDIALRRARSRCQLCNSTERLHVHHRTYARLGCEDPEDLTVLCAPCHAKFHDR